MLLSTICLRIWIPLFQNYDLHAGNLVKNATDDFLKPWLPQFQNYNLPAGFLVENTLKLSKTYQGYTKEL